MTSPSGRDFWPYVRSIVFLFGLPSRGASDPRSDLRVRAETVPGPPRRIYVGFCNAETRDGGCSLIDLSDVSSVSNPSTKHKAQGDPGDMRRDETPPQKYAGGRSRSRAHWGWCGRGLTRLNLLPSFARRSAAPTCRPPREGRSPARARRRCRRRAQTAASGRVRW